MIRSVGRQCELIGFRNMIDVRHTFAKLFRRSDLTIGGRLAACFLTIVLLMIAADAVAIWQLRELAAHTKMLDVADKASSAIVRLHLDVNSFNGRVVVLMRSHDTGQFSSEASTLRETFLRHVQDAEQVLSSSPEIAQDALISSTLKTLKTTLPSQIDSEIELANAGDWPAIQFRLAGQIQDLIDVSSSLVAGVEERVFQQRARVNEETQQVWNRLFIVVPAAWLVTLLVAAALGWYLTQTITIPLSRLTTGAQALARGDFWHEVNIRGNDELALLGNAFNHAARQLRHQFEMTLEARVEERTRIARELHDTLLQTLLGVLLQLKAVSQLLPERPLEAKEDLESAIEQAADAITEGRDAVQELRRSTGQHDDLALAIGKFGRDLRAGATTGQPAIRVAVDGESRDLHSIFQDEVYKIAAEALRNAFRHAQARLVEVEIRYDDEQFRMRVHDDGKGIDRAVLSPQALDGHYGLQGMRERATLIGGQLTVRTQADSGTEVELCVPAAKAYTTAATSSWLSESFSGNTKLDSGDRS
jgi:signal transduction histidine kinase